MIKKVCNKNKIKKVSNKNKKVMCLLFIYVEFYYIFWMTFIITNESIIFLQYVNFLKSI